MKLKKYKKGSVIDAVIWGVGAFLTIFILAALVWMFSQVDTNLSSIGQVGETNFTDITDKVMGPTMSILPTSLHTIAVIIIVMSGLSILIHNFLVKAHPVFFVTYFFMAVVGIITAAYISNQYMSLLSNEVLGSTLQGFTGANFIMQWLPYWTAVIGIFGAIFLFIGIIRDRTGGIQI